jgi:hypothetical protein
VLRLLGGDATLNDATRDLGLVVTTTAAPSRAQRGTTFGRVERDGA